MNSGNVGGPGTTPPVTNTETGSNEEVQKEGKLPGGSAVKKEGGATPIQDGNHPVGASASDKKIDMRKTERQHDFEPEVSDDNDEDVFMLPTERPETLALFSSEDIDELEHAALKEAGLSFEDAVEIAVDTMKKESKAMQSLKKFGDMFTAAFKIFADAFRPEPKVAEAFAKGTGQLVDLATDGMNETDAEKVATEIASNLESKPDAVLKEMENRGLTEVVTEIKDTMRVATKKNLMKMKHKLMESGDNFPALQGMSDEARELMLNATLSAAKLGNPGSKKTDITQLVDRGYIVGKIPTAKLRLVEVILKSSPEAAIAQLKEWLPNTNFATEIDETVQLQGFPELFENNELEVAENPSGVQHTDIEMSSPAARARMHDKKSDLSSVFNELTNPDKIEIFKEDSKISDVKGLFAGDELEVDENPKAPQRDPEGTATNKLKREIGLINEQVEERRKDMMGEETSKSAMAHAKMIHKGIHSNTLFNKIRDKESDQAALAQYETAKTTLLDQGGLTQRVEEDLLKLQSAMEDTLVEQGAEDAALLSRAILVANKLAAWTDPASSDAITLLGAVATTAKYYGDVFDTASSMAQQDVAQLLDGLLQNPAVKHSDFESKLIPGQSEDE